MSSTSKKLILVIFYIIIIILIPLFLDVLFKYTVRKKRKDAIMKMARQKSKKIKIPIMIINHGDVTIIKDKTFTKLGKYSNIEKSKDEKHVIVIIETLEYIEEYKINDFLSELYEISDGNMYFVNIEKNSPRIWWDYNIKNVMDKSFYLPNDKIIWSTPDKIQKKIQKFYYYVFKILPYRWFVQSN